MYNKLHVEVTGSAGGYGIHDPVTGDIPNVWKTKHQALKEWHFRELLYNNRTTNQITALCILLANKHGNFIQ